MTRGVPPLALRSAQTRIRTGTALVTALLFAVPAGAQEGTPPPARVPFGVGERLEYQVKFGKVSVGSGAMEVLAMDTVRGHDVWHTLFNLRGGIPFYRVNDKYESWFEVSTLASLRYLQDIDEGNYEPKRHYEIFPNRREYIETNKEGKSKDPQESVDHPLDEGSFIYFLRTIPLRPGLDTTFNDYFKAKANPIRLKVAAKLDTIDTELGRLAALVVQPIFESKLFSEGGHAEIWLSDDENRILLQLKSKVSFGSLNLYVKSYRPSPTTNAPPLNRVKPSQH
jgi:hypothetical protein